MYFYVANIIHVVCASVAVLDNGAIRTVTAGKLIDGEKQDVTPGTVFEAASLSKPVFAYLVLKIVERGELDLDTPLSQISNKGFGPPELQGTPQYLKLTARMILSHQTGLRNWIPSTESCVDHVSTSAECTKNMREQLLAIKSADATMDATTENIQKPSS